MDESNSPDHAINDEDLAQIIININDNLQDLLKYLDKITTEKNKLKEELLNIKQHINKFFDEI